MSGRSFALAQLEKYGWKEGKGLGRHESGNPEPLKPQLKFDSAGLGHDRAEEFKFNWWDHVFNKASSNLDVVTQDGKVQVTRKEELQVSKKLSADTKKMLYGGFIKGGTLNKKELETSSDESEDEAVEKDLSCKLTDEQLFRLCGGKTAHKGARHGIKMSAKLARVQQQDQHLLEPQTTPAGSPSTTAQRTQKLNNGDGFTEVRDNSAKESNGNKDDAGLIDENLHTNEKKKKKKKKSKDVECSSTPVDIAVNTSEENNEPSRKEKKKKKKAKYQEEATPDDSHTLNHEQNTTTDSLENTTAELEAGTERKKKKKKKDKCKEKEEVELSGENVDPQTSKKSKRKREATMEDAVADQTEESPKKKKKKKKTRSD